MPGLRAGTAAGEREQPWLPQPRGLPREVRELPGPRVLTAPGLAAASHRLLPLGFPELSIHLLGAALKLEAEAVAVRRPALPSPLAGSIRPPACSVPTKGIRWHSLKLVQECVFDRHNLLNI